jgi:pilus assembly protein CpaF
MDEAYSSALGPIRPLVEDERISEVMVNGPDRVYVEMRGQLYLTDIRFLNEEELLGVIEHVVSSVGRTISRDEPLCDARLADGSRVHAALPPVAVDGPALTIRKFPANPLQVEDLVGFGTVTEIAMSFLRLAVLAKANIIVSGGTGSGKTTFLNVLSSFIPVTERIVTIEDAAELRLLQDHVVRLEARPRTGDERPIPIRELVINSLRMRPNRIVVGECRGGEALDMLQAMNTGHDGSMTTLHANGPREALTRLETMVLMAGMDLPVHAIRTQVAAAIDMIVQLDRLSDGSRRVTSVTEIAGMEGQTITMHEVFKLERDGDPKAPLRPTGVRPLILNQMLERGVQFPADLEPLFGSWRAARGGA